MELVERLSLLPDKDNKCEQLVWNPDLCYDLQHICTNVLVLFNYRGGELIW